MINPKPKAPVRFRQRTELLKKIASIIDKGSLTAFHAILLFEAVTIDCRQASDVFNSVL